MVRRSPFRAACANRLPPLAQGQKEQGWKRKGRGAMSDIFHEVDEEVRFIGQFVGERQFVSVGVRVFVHVRIELQHEGEGRSGPNEAQVVELDGREFPLRHPAVVSVVVGASVSSMTVSASDSTCPTASRYSTVTVFVPSPVGSVVVTVDA